MENKYYTPDISEFHVGFEYEDYWNEKWNKEIYSEISFIKEGGPDEPFEVIEIDPKYHRVKYLDIKDIESLGFKLIKSSNETELHFIKNEIKIWANLNTQKCIILNKGLSAFVGKIKNKSELIKLLKQLEI